MAQEEEISVLRHSTAHVMAQAVKELFPKAKIAIGPAIDTGFYYDFDYDPGFTDGDLRRIEEKMKEIIEADVPFERQVLSRQEAIDLFKRLDEPYKLEILEEIEDEMVTVYRQGSFVDLCRGPHVRSTGEIGAFKLLSTAGAYWRGDEKRKMLRRIYGTAFFDEASLRDYLTFLEEVKKRDHRRLGRELDLFSVSDEVGAGLVIYHPQGAMIRYVLEDFLRKEHLKRGYELVYGPHILKVDMWKRSGHYDHYRDLMYFTKVDDEEYGIKPMNCLSHIVVYKSKIRSYRDLPLRLFELGTVTRHERSGVLHGLLRVREFTQDDAHIFLREDQLFQEISSIICFIRETMSIFGFDYEIEVSTRPESYIGTQGMWDRAEAILEEVLRTLSMPFEINEGEGAFYGPKIDVKLKDALGRKWQCATIQCDFALPERFDLFYMDRDGQRRRPVILHRVIVGALERFIGILIEHYAGKFPLWLSPTQVVVMTVTEKEEGYAKSVFSVLRERGFRAELDDRNETLAYKVRQAVQRKIPYLVIVGRREAAENTLTVRGRDEGEMRGIILEEFMEMMKKRIEARR